MFILIFSLFYSMSVSISHFPSSSSFIPRKVFHCLLILLGISSSIALPPLTYYCSSLFTFTVSIYLSIYLSIFLSGYLSFYLSIWIFVFLSFYLSSSIALHPLTYYCSSLFIFTFSIYFLSGYFSFYLSISRSIYLSVHLCNYLST